MKPVPMNQICLLNDCKKPAKFEKEGMYYCAECLDKSTVAIADNELIINVFKDAIEQIKYLRGKLTPKTFMNTKYTTEETVSNIEEVIKLIKEKK